MYLWQPHSGVPRPKDLGQCFVTIHCYIADVARYEHSSIERRRPFVTGIRWALTHFLPEMAAICKPPIKMLKKGCLSLGVLRMSFRAHPGLSFVACSISIPKRRWVSILTADASYQVLRSVLSQSPKGSHVGEIVIAYASRSLKPTEGNYAPTRLEFLGVVWAVHHFRHYLAGRRFTLYTDPVALQYIFNPNPAPSLSVGQHP